MKVGDIVKKTKGDWDLNKLGYIIQIKSNGYGTTLITVVVGAVLKTWPGDLVEVVSETR